jgi:hypothetical protein
MIRRHPFLISGSLAVLLLLLLFKPASSMYYRATKGEGCIGCHEMTPVWEAWKHSSHRSVNCLDCHENNEMANSRRASRHVQGNVPEQIRLKGIDVVRIMERCKNCHRQEFAQWQAGPHGSPFSKVFTDAKHNSQRLLMDDCLRCHGSYYEGGISSLVTPVDTKGPWKFVDRKWADQPVAPCFACHQIHRQGEPLHADRTPRPHPAAEQEIGRPSLAHFDRREMAHVALADLPLPAMQDHGAPVKVSPDTRQALCYQCHAPLNTRQVGSGDDRTAIGVHEGVSCMACHSQHGETTRASCTTCHPKMSNCGLDVEKMDTSFASATSRHNIHFVKCSDCHENGVPRRAAAVTPHK